MVITNRIDVALDQTVKIAQHLSPESDQKLKLKLIYSIFDDQLKAHTNLNRKQRHDARMKLKEALKKHGVQ